MAGDEGPYLPFTPGPSRRLIGLQANRTRAFTALTFARSRCIIVSEPPALRWPYMIYDLSERGRPGDGGQAPY